MTITNHFMKIVITTIILYCLPMTLQATAIKPLSLKITDPTQTSGLSIVEMTLPLSAFTESADDDFHWWQWRVYDKKNQLQHIHFEADSKEVVKLYALLRNYQSSELDFFYSKAPDFQSDQPAFTITINPADAQPGSPLLLKQWSKNRNLFFAEYTETDIDSHLFKLWSKLAANLYEGDTKAFKPERQRRWRNRRNRRNNLSAFSLFSGEAAIQETLQQQLLTGVKTQQAAKKSLQALKGPKVPSHPFAKMLDGKPGGILPIANLVPPDRYFVHIDDTRKVLAWLEQFAKTGSQIAGLQNQTYLNHNLINRYLERLHLSYDLAKNLANQVKQMALFGPDLFLTDGSEITLILDTGHSPFFNMFMPLLGIMSGNEGVQAYASDNPAFFAQHEQWLILSTSRTEAAMALALAKNQGKNSLGQSAEFRYMLAHLPKPEKSQGLLVYLSDPFIRAMVGAKIKIAQYRRHQAKARLHLITAGSLLYQMDQGKVADLAELLSLGYVKKEWLQSWEGDEITLDKAGIPHSRLYGTLAQMTPISKLSIETISIGELKAYRVYVRNYSRFWRTFFDPIGIRITVSNPLKIETLILPLVQNSIYRNLQGVIGGKPVTMGLPEFTPKPITTLSVNLSTQAKAMLSQIMSKRRNDPEFAAELVELLGNSLHIAFYDNDPLVALGSADLIGGFSGQWLRRGRAGNFFALALLGSMLTQPTAVFVELKNPEKLGTLEQQGWFFEDLLWQMSASWANSKLHLLTGEKENTWVYTYNFEGVIRFHLYLKVIDNYLIISNQNLNFSKVLQSIKAKPANARLHILPDQIQKMKPELHLHHLQNQQAAAMKNIGRLMPFLLMGAKNPEQASEKYARIYGRQLTQSENEEWHWDPIDNYLENSLFGSPGFAKLPQFLPSKSPFEKLQAFDLRFLFEEEGARVILNVTY